MHVYQYYTPGHDVFFDTFAMYGLASILDDLNVEFSVIPLGNRYIIEVYDVIDEDKFRGTLLKKLSEENLRRELSMLRVFNKEWNLSVKIADKILEGRVKLPPLSILQDPEHGLDEGRGKVRANYINVYLPLSPLYGKYYTTFSGKLPKGDRSAQMLVCSLCASLASIGYAEAAMKKRFRYEGGIELFTLTLQPTAKTSREKLMALKTLITLTGEINIGYGKSPPGKIIPLIVMASEVLSSIKGGGIIATPMNVLYYVMERERRGAEPRSIGVHPFGPYLGFLREIIESGMSRENVVDIVQRLLGRRQPEYGPLETLSDAILHRDIMLLYEFMRELWTLREEVNLVGKLEPELVYAFTAYAYGREKVETALDKVRIKVQKVLEELLSRLESGEYGS